MAKEWHCFTLGSFYSKGLKVQAYPVASVVPGVHRSARNNRTFPALLSGAMCPFNELSTPQTEAETTEKSEGPWWH